MIPFIIPIFIQHQGCPHRCIFCDQNRITGRGGKEEKLPSPLEIQETIDRCLAWPRKKRRVELAFYGGSFTGLPLHEQQELLGAAQPYLQSGEISSIRLSTRPDYIDRKIVQFLKERHVSLVEIGVQSMEPQVLEACRRGHSGDDVEAAFYFLRESGIGVGAQLMVGLPGETTGGVLGGAEKIAALAPDCVRIYPAVVLKGSGLERLYHLGKYKPPAMNKTLAVVCRLKEIFDRHNIAVIRMGLQHAEDLEDNIVAGPYHQAFGEMVHSRMLFKKARKALGEKQGKKTISIASSDQSIFRGCRNKNIQRLTELGLLDNVEMIFQPLQARQTVVVASA